VTSLARGEDGNVFAGTIDGGTVYRLRPPQGGHAQRAEVFAQLANVQHVWALAWDAARHTLLAATGSEGKLFAIDRAGHATVVFDSDEPHLYSLGIAPDGTAYAGSGGGHAILYAVRGPGQARSVARFTGDEVRGIAFAGENIFVAANEFPDTPTEPSRRTSVTPSRVPTAGGPTTARPHPGRGDVYRVTHDGVSERLYHNGDTHITALEWDASHGGQVLAGLATGGRVIAIALDRTSRVAIDVDETQVLALALSGRARMFGTGDAGAIYHVTSDRPAGATWTSKLLDASTVSRWGAVRWRGNGALDWEARSGNADPPDSTWSAWQALTPEGVIPSPSARYLQVRARWTRDPNTVMRSVTVYYLPTNQRAVLTEVTAEAKIGDPRPQAVKIGWKVENPDSDTLRYRLRFRGDTEQNWRSVLRQGEYVTGSTSYDWSVEGLPEGYYRVQVEASDEASNPDPEVQRDVRASEPVLVDNTPPHVTARIANNGVSGEANDGASAVTRIEISVDTQDWRPLRARDGVLDERVEQFDAPIPALNDGGEHVLAIRAYDEAGNVGSTSATFRAPGPTPAATVHPAPRH
jgi:hypothetical protein